MIKWLKMRIAATRTSMWTNRTLKRKAYASGRYLDQIAWYDARSALSKLFYDFPWAVIILSSCIPVLVVSLGDVSKWLTGGLGVVLAIGTAGLKTFKFQENWIKYRSIAEALKKEQYFYDAGMVDYSSATDREALFVERAESVTSRKNIVWVTSRQKR
jgi:hypothetical protein